MIPPSPTYLARILPWLLASWLLVPSLRAAPAAWKTFLGLSDASAAVMLDEVHFAVGDDEDNVIRIYHLAQPGRPVQSMDVSRFLQVEAQSPEADIEGAARIGNRVFWITSHGRNAKGEACASRQRFFALDIVAAPPAPRLVPAGHPYGRLLTDLLGDERFRGLGLGKAAALPPKAAGALNIEGLAATPEGHLLIGFRNPLINGQALVIPLLNPAAVIEGYPAQFGDAVLVNLGGQGIRSLSDWQQQYLVVAGATGDGGIARLFSWLGLPQAPTLLPETALVGFNPESVALVPHTNATRLLFISDDGTLKVGGRPAKKIKDPALRPFRALLTPLPSPPR